MTSAYWVLLFMLIPLIVWGYLWYKNVEIVLWEWAVATAVPAVMSCLVFMVAAAIRSADKETWSGYTVQALHTPWWRAEWTELETYTTTDSKGQTQTHTRLVTKSETHQPRWWLATTIGDVAVNEGMFDDICRRYGGYSERGYRPDFDEGDRNDYFSNEIPYDADNPVYPVHKHVSWSNPLLGTDSIVLGREIPEEEARAKGLFYYPQSSNELSSARVLGGANISTYRWDQLNASVGASKKVNLIIINFGDRSADYAILQRDYWRNGRKNDLVLCYGDGWSYVFGWSKRELVKQELQSILLNPVSDALIPQIRDAIRQHFEPYEWKQHVDTPSPVSGWAVFVAFVTTCLAQWGLYFAFHTNSHDKNESAKWLSQFKPHSWKRNKRHNQS